jgi:tetratricopeptide (TPR) repeat protein
MVKARDWLTPQRSNALRLALGTLLAALLLAGCAGGAGETPTAAAPAPQLSAQEYFDQGNALYEQGDLQAAANAFREAVALDDQNVGYWHNLGVAYYSLNALDEARESFQRGLALAPDDAELNYLMGAVAIQFEQLSEAETYLTRANQLDPALPEPYFGLGVLYRLQGQREQAIAAFETFLELGPGQDPAAIPVAEAELEALRAGQ